jgi:disulfide oxidoreductase YuzD
MTILSCSKTPNVKDMSADELYNYAIQTFKGKHKKNMDFIDENLHTLINHSNNGDKRFDVIIAFGVYRKYLFDPDIKRKEKDLPNKYDYIDIVMDNYEQHTSNTHNNNDFFNSITLSLILLALTDVNNYYACKKINKHKKRVKKIESLYQNNRVDFMLRIKVLAQLLSSIYSFKCYSVVELEEIFERAKNTLWKITPIEIKSKSIQLYGLEPHELLIDDFIFMQKRNLYKRKNLSAQNNKKISKNEILALSKEHLENAKKFLALFETVKK